ncbi:MAG: GtrA family protein [Firmicutes bacterium]|nr:GtrA family protein [Alicyclobacillaceae bacterium]MCL6497567.1 GtrA family protein [Bacillota bacterium]
MATAVSEGIRQWVRFQAVGAVNAGVDWGVFGLLTWVAPPRSVAWLVVENTLAVLASLCVSYLGNSRWTFAGRKTGGAATMGKFLGQGLVNLAINNGALAGLGSLWLTRSLIVGWGGLLAKAAAALMASMVSFGLMRHWVFPHPEPKPATSEPPAGR